ncbi:uncharacterized protein LOC128214579 [Mya arenaria]|uniref:uncharacterized protein LOC128214579 n=1 Tax=Mya arenaria TaxID=6604 RepID=UPI0022E67304|nr:uncharacterized protein LOC128214579 [Mya arenaria]
MSAETPLDDSEIHDLVLMFSNSRMPRGSDAFQTLVGDFLKNDSPEPVPTADDVDATVSDSSDASGGVADKRDGSDGELISVRPVPRPMSLLKEPGRKKSVRTVSPKPGHVHWPDEINRDIASSPTTGKLHSARLYNKTTPKPILKHDEALLVHDLKNPT